MATLVINDLNDQMVSDYEKASEDERQQVNKVIEDILRLWTQRRSDISQDEKLWQEVLEFGMNHETFPLDWAHNKLTREEMNER